MGYEVYYSSERLRADLHFVIDRFYDLAKSRGLRPIVVFIPRKPGDQHSADRMVGELRERFPSSELPVLALGRMTELGIDWSRFNLVPGHCHPSRYGQGMVARAIAAEIGL